MSGNIDNFSRTDARDSFDPADSFREQPRPEHHLHRESETLPGSDPMGYDQDQTKDTRALEGRRDIDTGTSFTHFPLYSLGRCGYSSWPTVCRVS